MIKKEVMAALKNVSMDNPKIVWFKNGDRLTVIKSALGNSSRALRLEAQMTLGLGVWPKLTDIVRITNGKN